MKIIVWNARGVGNRPTIRQLKYLVKMHNPSIVAVFEPFINDDRGDEVRESLGFDNFMANGTGDSKIWLFSKVGIRVDLLSAFSQGLTVSIFDGYLSSSIIVTFVYASCNVQERR